MLPKLSDCHCTHIPFFYLNRALLCYLNQMPTSSQRSVGFGGRLKTVLLSTLQNLISGQEGTEIWKWGGGWGDRNAILLSSMIKIKLFKQWVLMNTDHIPQQLWAMHPNGWSQKHCAQTVSADADHLPNNLSARSHAVGYGNKKQRSHCLSRWPTESLGLFLERGWLILQDIGFPLLQWL